jgi:hypothetical protein
MLRTVYQDSSEDMHGQLWEAVRTGLVMRSEEAYRFLHDRVQEAAYSLIPQALRAEAHLRIGMSMVSHTSPDKLEEGIFEIVNQKIGYWLASGDRVADELRTQRMSIHKATEALHFGAHFTKDVGCRHFGALCIVQ